MDRPGVPICVITGFLGSGKTTLLNHILSNRQGLRAVVFVNEFGAVDVDGRLVRWRGSIDEDKVVTLDNGCMCCEVNADFDMQLRRVLREHAGSLDAVFVETSGICDPGPMLSTLEIQELDFRTNLDSILAVVDATAVCEEGGIPGEAARLGLKETAWAQLASSDIVLLNKCDLLGGAGGDRAAFAEASLLRRLGRRGAPASQRILRSEHASVDLSLVVSLRSSSSAAGGGRGREGGEAIEAARGSRPPAKKPRLAVPYGHSKAALRAAARSFAYTSDRPFDPAKFEAWVESGIPRSVCRAKGLLWMRGVPRHVIFQLAGARTNPFETAGASAGPPKGSELVFIGEARAMLDGDEREIMAALDACLC